MTSILKVDNAAVFAGAKQLVAPVSFELRAGSVFTILGETGSGKSLLAQAIVGLLPDALTATGTMTIDGNIRDIAKPSAFKSLWGRAFSVLPQEPWLSLDPTMRAVDQVIEAHRFVRGLGKTAAAAAARADLNALGVADAGHKLPGQLSGGMAQRVAFAAARAGGARIVIADEPTKGLDVNRRDEVIDLLAQEVRQGGSVLVITHDLSLARKMGGEIAILLEGKIIEQGDAETVLTRPVHSYTRRLIDADPENWPKRVTTLKLKEPILLADEIAKARGGRQLFSGENLRLRRGEIVGITGPSGSGKSSFGDIALGLLRPDSGSIIRLPGIARHRFQKIYQDPPAAFPSRITIGQNLQDVIRLHKLDAKRLPPLMERLRLSRELLTRLPSEVSGGELQRFSIARAMLVDPVFLFADEPTSRLDPITQQETINLLVELAEKDNCAVLIVSHDNALIEKTCDSVFKIGTTTLSSQTSRIQPAVRQDAEPVI